MQIFMSRKAMFTQLALVVSSVLFTISFTATAQDTTPQIYQTSFANVSWNNADWTLTTTYPDPRHYQTRANLANGYIGISLSSLGPFFEVDEPVGGDLINEWPLFDRRQSWATVSGFYDVQATTNGTNYEWLNQLGGESVISGIPHWSGLLVQAGDQLLNVNTSMSQISNFSSTFDFKQALVSWNYSWTIPDGPTLLMQYSMFVHKLYVNQAAVQLQMTSMSDANVTVNDVLDGDAAVRSFPLGTQYMMDNNTIMSSVQPNNIPYVSAFVYSTMVADGTLLGRFPVTNQTVMGGNASSIGQAMNISLMAGQPATISKFIGVASSDAFDNAQAVAANASSSGAQQGFDNLLASHVGEWQSIMTAENVDDFAFANGSLPAGNDTLDTVIFAVTGPFYLLQNTLGPNAIAMANNNTKLATHSISVCGLVDSCYGGLVFWDVEVWMSPGLMVSFPEHTHQIPNYRAARYDTAKQNVMEAYTSSQNKTMFSPDAAIFPWTSGRFGNCTGTGPCFDYEYHINGDIALELENYLIATGDMDTFNTTYFPMYDSVAKLYTDLLYMNTTTGTYMLSNATDPDEFTNNINNPGYTMALIQTRLRNANEYRSLLGLPTNDTYEDRASNIYIPETPPGSDPNLLLQFTDMNNSIIVKQADIVLIDDFLAFPNPHTLSDLSYYAGHQSPDGPGMTYAVFSIVASRYATSGCAAYTYDLYGRMPYTRAPWYQFSEQLLDNYQLNGGFHPAFPFLTGMGGANRVAPFGYLGLRMNLTSFHIDPALPPQIPNLRYRTLFWQGHAVMANSNLTHTTLKRNATGRLSTANPVYDDNPIPVTLGPNATQLFNLTFDRAGLVVENRQPHLVLTVPDNMAQCIPVTSTAETVPGQFALAAVDGSESTSWQPTNANVTTNMTVDLGSEIGANGTLVRGFAFNWAQNPPVSFSVSFANQTESPGVQVLPNTTATVSNPWDAVTAQAAVLAPYSGNTTNVTLPAPVPAGRYATLTIYGNQNKFNLAQGAQVAEWAILQA